jgi:hypothetical protein
VPSPDEDAEQLFKALQGTVNDAVLINILGHRTRAQVLEVIAAFDRKYARNLKREIDQQTRGKGLYHDLLLHLLSPQQEAWADILYESLHTQTGLEACLIDLFSQLSHEELSLLGTAWQYKYQQSESALPEVVGRIADPQLKSLLAPLLTPARLPLIDHAKIEAEAIALGQSKDYLGVFTGNTPEYLQALAMAYNAKCGTTLEQAITADTSGSFRKGLLAFLAPSPAYWAMRAKEAVDENGARDDVLAHVFAFNGKDRIAEVAQRFQAMYSQPLAQVLSQRPQVDYLTLMLALLE